MTREIKIKSSVGPALLRINSDANTEDELQPQLHAAGLKTVGMKMIIAEKGLVIRKGDTLPQGDFIIMLFPIKVELGISNGLSCSLK